jgi:predicted CoA-binding protein
MKNVAVVGMSKDPAKDSHEVGLYLKSIGFNVYPVNPTTPEIEGMKSYASLPDLPEEIKSTLDIVDVFRRSEDIPPIADQALQLHGIYSRPQVFWMQLGIKNDEAAQKLRSAGLQVFQDICMMATHRLLKRTGRL